MAKLLKNVLAGGFIGAILGIGFTGISLITKGQHEELYPKPTCFDMDDRAYQIFIELAPFKTASTSAYESAIATTDSIFILEKELIQKKIPATDEIAETAQILYNRGLMFLNCIAVPQSDVGTTIADKLIERWNTMIKEHIMVIENIVKSNKYY